MNNDKTPIIMIVVAVVLFFIFWGTIAYVAYHFTSKFW